MEFQIILRDPADVTLTNAGYVLGYFKLKSKDISVNFFDERYCMVLPTLVDLLDFLSSDRWKKGLRIYG